MDEFEQGRRVATVAETLANKVFDRFDVVVGGRFDRLDALGIVSGEPVNQFIEHVLLYRSEWTDLGDFRLIRQELQPANLHENPEAYQSVFAADFA